MRPFLFGCIILLLSNCSAEVNPYDSLEAPELETKLLFEIHDRDDIMLGAINDVYILPDNAIAVLDLTRVRIHLFSPEGTYIRTFLEEGRGPGEVQRLIGNLGVTSDGKVLLYDQSLRRGSIYQYENQSLSHIDDIDLDFFPSRVHILPDDKLAFHVTGAIRDEQEPDRIIITDSTGTILNEALFDMDRNEQLVILSDEGAPFISIASQYHSQNALKFSENKLLYARTGHLGFKIIDLQTGTVTTDTSIEQPDIPLPDEQRREFVNDIVDQLGMGDSQRARLISEMPDARMKINAVIYDKSGFIWLQQTAEEDSETSKWLIFDESGELKHTFIQSFTGRIMAVENGKIYARTNSDDELPVLSVFEIDG